MFHELRKRLAERARINRDIRRLKSLDDRLLEDVGVIRHDIAACVAGRC